MSGTSQNKDTDEQLIEQMKRNIETGTALMMETYSGLIWTVCSNYLQEKEDIKECVNEVFAEFSLNYEKFKKEKGSLKNYLCSIAKNCAVDKYNKNLRQKQIEQAAANQWIRENEDSQKGKDKELLKDALEHLAPIDSQIIRMKYYDGLTFKEIAEQLHMDYNLVKKRSQRSYKKLLKIILIGLLLALLAACAGILFRQYRVSEQSGFLWSVETAAYGNEENTEEYVNGEVSYQITDTVYYDSQLKVEITARWMGKESEDWKEDLKKTLNEQFFEMIRKARETKKSGKLECCTGTVFLNENGTKYMLPCSYGMKLKSIDDHTKTVKLYLEYEGFIAENEEEVIILNLVLSEKHRVPLVLKPLPMMEYKYKEEKIQLGDGSILAIGPNYTGDTNTILSLYHTGGTEYEAASWLTNHFSGIGIWTAHIKPIMLTDKDGKAVESQRVTSENSNDTGIQKDYQIYFPKMDSGEYTLEIPYLCLLKEGVTKETVLELPTEDNVVMECNYDLFFEDGSGYRITGIRRMKEVETVEALDFDGNLIIQEFVSWNYYLTYETVSADSLIFCCSNVDGTSETGAMVSGNMDRENQFYLKVQQAEAPIKFTVTFIDPVYIMDEPIAAPIRIQNEE